MDLLLGGGSFLVTLTPTGANTGTVDKTYNEIKTALENGQIPIMNLVVNGVYNYSLIFNRIKPESIVFVKTEYVPPSDGTSLIIRQIAAAVLSDNTVAIGQWDAEISVAT